MTFCNAPQQCVGHRARCFARWGLAMATWFALACGGNDHPTGPGGPSAIASVTVTAAAPTVDVGISDTLVAKALTTDGTLVGNAVITFTHSAPAIASLSAVGTTAFVSGLALGVDTITAIAQSPGGPVVGRTTVTVTTPTTRVAQIQFPYRLVAVSAGQTISVNPTTTDQFSKAVAGANITYSVLPSTLGTVSSHGVFAASSGASGTGKVVASVNGHVDTLRIAVGGGANDLPLALSDSVVRPGSTLTVSSTSGLTGATASVGHYTAQVTAGSNGTLTITADTQLFTPCAPIGTSTSLTVSASGATRTVAVALFAPAYLTLAAGTATAPSSATTTGCPTVLTQPGTYVIVPYTWDQHETDQLGDGAPAPTVPAVDVTIGFGSIGAAAAAPAGDRMVQHQLVAPSQRHQLRPLSVGSFGVAGLRHPTDVVAVANYAVRTPTFHINAAWYRAVMSQHGGTGTRIPQAVADLAPPTSGGSCPVPLALGATIQLGTYRLADGTFVQPGAPIGSATDPTQGLPIEPWTLVGIGNSVAVFADTALINAMPQMPGADLRLQKLATAYDSTIAPFIARNSVGVPDHDGNGRVVVLIAKRGQSGYAFPTGYGRADCTQTNNIDGEAIQPAFVDFFSSDVQFQHGFATVLSELTHETSHLADEQNFFFPPTGTPRRETWWSSEGQAVLMQYLWAYGSGVTAIQAFASNTPTPPMRTVEGSTAGGFCEQSSHQALALWYQLGSYPLACQYVRYLFAQSFGINPSQTIKDLYTTWADMPDRTSTGNARSAMLGTLASDHDAMRDWLLSWYADDHVTGVNVMYTDPSVVLRTWWSTWFPGQYPVPDAVLAAGAQQHATLGEPDARFYEITTSPGGSSYITVGGDAGPGLSTGTADVVVLRAQ